MSSQAWWSDPHFTPSLSCGPTHFRRSLESAGKLRSGTQAPSPAKASPCYHLGRATGRGRGREGTGHELSLTGLCPPSTSSFLDCFMRKISFLGETQGVEPFLYPQRTSCFSPSVALYPSPSQPGFLERMKPLCPKASIRWNFSLCI